MTSKLRLLPLACLIFIIGGSISNAQTDDAQRTIDFYNGFDGRWEGAFKREPSQVFDPLFPTEAPADPTNPPVTNTAFTINKNSAQVYLKDGAFWNEIKAGGFRFLASGTNAVLFSITGNVSNTPTGSWVETWNFTITHKDRDSLQVVVVRAVNNFTHPSDYLSENGKTPGRFFHQLYGEMTRQSG